MSSLECPEEYNSLADVLQEAIDQASKGKGIERHAKFREPFEEQKICEIARRVGVGYDLGQAIKKSMESVRLPYPRNINELLGAINYLAGAVIVMREEGENLQLSQEDNRNDTGS